MDKCEDSGAEDLTIYEYKPYTATKESYLFGDGTKNSCVPGKLGNSALAQFVLASINYFYESTVSKVEVVE